MEYKDSEINDNEDEDFDEEADDIKLWQEELARQARACNKGIV